MTIAHPIAKPGTASVSVDGTISILEIRGRFTVELSDQAQRELDRIAAQDARVDRLLFDVRAIDGYEPGLPARWIRWSMQRARPNRRVAFVGASVSGFAVTATLRYFIPKLKYGVFRTREAAMAFLRERD